MYGFGALSILSVAKVAPPKKAYVRTPDMPGLSRCVHSTSGAPNDLRIPKVVLEITVVSEEQSRTTDSGQRENVFVVRTTDTVGANCIGL